MDALQLSAAWHAEARRLAGNTAAAVDEAVNKTIEYITASGGQLSALFANPDGYLAVNKAPVGDPLLLRAIADSFCDVQLTNFVIQSPGFGVHI